MSTTVRLYGLALALPMLAAVGACSDTSVLAPERLAPRAPSRNVISNVPGSVQLCTRGFAGLSTYSVSYTPGAGSTSTYALPQGTAVSQLSGDCITVFTATTSDNSALDPEAHVLITQLTTPVGSAFNYTLVTELIIQAACNPISDPCGADVKGGNKAVTLPVNAYHGSVVSYWNASLALGCAYTQGYWKNHLSSWPAGYSPNATFFSSGLSWINLWNTAPKGSAYIILAHQYMAAALNVAKGATMPASVKTVFDAATTYFNGGASGPLTSWATTLDNFNSGIVNGGPPHCD